MRTFVLSLAGLFACMLAHAQMTLVLQPDSTGKDCLLYDLAPTGGMPDNPEFDACAWTIQGMPMRLRSLIDFDWSQVPANATVVSATLTLYNNPTSTNGFQNGEHSHYSGSNAAWLQRITSPWAENVSWSAQPSTTTLNQVTLPQDTTPHQDYVIDVTQLVIDQIDNAGSSFGFMLRLQTEQQYRLLAFASSDYPDPAKRPKLEIQYTTPTAVPPAMPEAIGFHAWPNPAHGWLEVNSLLPVDEYFLNDAEGRLILQGTPGNNRFSIDLSGQRSGIYLLTVRSGSATESKRVGVK